MAFVKSELSRALNDAVLRRLAGEQSYHRGHDYYSHGHVESIEPTDSGLRAVVLGTENYSVALSSDEGVLDYSCDCQLGADSIFCKHCVAAGLAWLNLQRDGSKANGKSRQKSKRLTLKDAAESLRSEDKNALVEMVIAWANEDERLHERLLIYAARRAGPETATVVVRKAFEDAVQFQRFVDYRGARAWAARVHNAIDEIEQLLNSGPASSVIDLCESALQLLAAASGSLDDSDGHLTDLRNRLEGIHFQACEEARPDPVALARRLFEREMEGHIDIFYGAVERYAGILGPKGLKEYRILAEAQWEKVPCRTAKDDANDYTHARITKIMEGLARTSGNIEELVAVLCKNLSHPYNYLTIAEEYRSARPDLALLWAENGLKAFPLNPDRRLREFVAAEYQRLKRSGDAIELMWAEFSERPSLETFQKLEGHAKTAKDWPAWRDRALAEIRRRVGENKNRSNGRTLYRWKPAFNDHSLLVQIFLYEDDTEAAWREAQAGGCSSDLWLRLASAREQDHPEDAAAVYLKQAEVAVVTSYNHRYGEGVDLLVKASKLMNRMGRSDEFSRALDALLVRYKAKKNFVKLIEQKKKLLYPRINQ